MTSSPDRTGMTGEAESSGLPAGDLIDIRQWLGSALWPDRWRILGVTGATALVAFAIALLVPKSYESRVSITVTAAEMEVNGRIAMSASLLATVREEAKKRGFIKDGETLVLRADPDTTNPSNPTRLLALIVRARMAESAQGVADVWARNFMDIASESIRSDRQAVLDKLQQDLETVKADLEKAREENERIIVQTDREVVLLHRELGLGAKQQEATALAAAIVDLNKRLDSQQQAHFVSSFDAAQNARALGLGQSTVNSGGDVESAKLPSPRSNAALSALLQSGQLALANAQGAMFALEGSVSKLTAEVQSAAKEVDSVPATGPNGEPNPLRAELAKRQSQARIDLQGAIAQSSLRAAELQQHQKGIDALGAEIQQREFLDKWRAAAALQRQQEADIAAIQAELRQAQAKLDALEVDIGENKLRFEIANRALSRRREEGLADVNLGVNDRNKLESDISAIQKLLNAPATMRLVAIEAANEMSSVRYFMAIVAAALAFAAMVVVATVRHHVKAAGM